MFPKDYNILITEIEFKSTLRSNQIELLPLTSLATGQLTFTAKSYSQHFLKAVHTV